MTTRTPTFAEVHDTLRERILRDCHVAFPARVESYDSSHQTVDVKPLIAEFYTEDDDSITQVQPGVITAVPLMFPGAGGFRVTFPVNVGDTVLCVVADRSIDNWSQFGGPQAPGDQRRHNRSDAIAIPGLHAANASWAGASTSAITIGRDGGTADAAALASKVHAALEDLKTKFNSHTHPGVTSGGSATGTTATPSTADTAVDSQSVLIKE
jgi:Phage protein Gp138 N-terminal domain